MKDRDMYYGNYGYSGFSPIPNNMQIPTNMPNMMQPNTYGTNQLSDINERINRLERQVKRLDQRLTRLETPYANNNNNLYSNKPNNNKNNI